MMRAMFSGVSGVRVHQTKMDNIGNNIANVNTVGYKSSVVAFEEVYSQTVRGAGSPQGGVGGTNPQQIGLGVGVSSIAVDHNRGTPQRTDRPTDLMINGNGFFVVTNDPTFQNKFYTRAGNFTTDRLGYLTMPNGFKVLGQDGKPIRMDKTTTVTGTQTSKVEISGNVNYDDKIEPDTNIAYSTSMDVYDSLGRVNTVTINFGQKLEGQKEPTPNNNSYRAIQFVNPDLTGAGVEPVDPANPTGDMRLGSLETIGMPPAGAGNTPAGVYYAKFDKGGKFAGIVTDLEYDASGLVAAPADPANDPKLVADFNLKLQQAGADPVDIKLIGSGTPVVNAFENLTHYPKESSAVGKKIDGNAAGSLENFNISASGEVVGKFTNGETEVLGTLLIADFDNNEGLAKSGSNLFVDTVNSGVPKYAVAGTSGLGSILAGTIEMSNVDLSKQFTEMIITQRGFQANTRVITTSDEILQELVNLKR